MRIKVNPELCEGHNRCFALAPELFEVDDYGLSRALNDGVVPLGREERARLAVDNCPEFAISVVAED
ncbi:MAG: ferredoxin [Thiotrichales bacterium]|nr:ferredoxin [Thiotrichales bacterium]